MKKFFAKLFAKWAIKKILTRKKDDGKPEVQETESRRYSFEPRDYPEFWNTFMWLLQNGFALTHLKGSSYFHFLEPFPKEGMLTGCVKLPDGWKFPIFIDWLNEVDSLGRNHTKWLVRVKLEKDTIQKFANLHKMTDDETKILESIVKDKDCNSTLSVKIQDPTTDIFPFLDNFLRFLDTFLEHKADFIQKQTAYLDARKTLVSPSNPES